MPGCHQSFPYTAKSPARVLFLLALFTCFISETAPAFAQNTGNAQPAGTTAGPSTQAPSSQSPPAGGAGTIRPGAFPPGGGPAVPAMPTGPQPTGPQSGTSGTQTGPLPAASLSGEEPAATLAEPITLRDATAHEHEINKTLDLSPLYLSTAVEMHSFKALRAEASYDQSVRLRDAINYVLDHGLQIKNEREALIYQHWQTMNQTASALPTFLMSYSLTRSDVYNRATTSIGRTFFTGMYFPVFAGGGTVSNILAQYYREKAWHYVYRSTFQDVFLTIYQNYTNLLQQRVLLQIWAKAVEADQEQLRIANAQLSNGTGTKFAVLQAEAQLANDRQSFLNQEVTMRKAALTLNNTMNCPMDINLIPVEETLSEAPLFPDNVKISDLLNDAMKFSPGLRQYEYFRMVAQRNISVAAANYYPTVSFFVSWQFNDTTVTPQGNNSALGGAATAAINSSLNSSFVGRFNNNALGQQTGFDPTLGETAIQGVNAPPVALPRVSLPPSAGGTPISAMQSGSAVSSGAVAPSIFGGGSGLTTGSNANGSFQAPSGVFPGLFREWQMGFQFFWSVPNCGLSTTAQVLQARTISRQALLQCNQELIIVEQAIRKDYLTIMAARKQIDRAAAAVASSREALRIARVRLQGGVGTAIDVIAAQRDYITNLTAQAQAIVDSNVAQAQLLHDMGMINATTLTTGYHPGIYEEPRPTKKIHWLYP